MACRDEKASKEARKHSKRLGSSSKIEAVLKMLSTFEELQTSYEQFDAEPYDLNCKNGIIDLKDGGIRPHDPSSFLSKITDVPFVPDGIAPKWEKFISDITQGDDELSAYLQRAAGYSLTGAFPEHAFFMLVGSRRNGKTTFLEILRRCMGDYAVTVQVGALMERRSSDLNPDIPKLRGARFCTTSETESNQRLGLGLVKALTGGGTIAGRELYMGPVEFTPYVKLWMDTNSPPYMSPRDKGTWARAQIIPFDRCFEGQEDPNLRQKLLHELPGILKWMVQGAGARLDEGLNTPQIVRDKTAEIRGEQNTVKGFIEDVCEERNFDQLRVEDTKHTTLPEAPLVDLYEEYVLWCHASGCRELSKREFVKELESMGHEKTEGRGHARMIRGLLIVDSMKNSKE
jgi:putative DNA primase/helicase